MTRKVTNKCLAYLSALFPKFPLNAATIKAYDKALRDIPDDILLQAVEAVAVKCKFFPTVSEIRDTVLDLQQSIEKMPTAGEAWDAALSRWRPPRSEYYDHPIVERCVRAIGGWTYLANSNNLVSDRARFLDAYRTFQDRDRQMARLPASVKEHVAQLADENKKAQVDEAIAQLLAGKKK
jgi:hypothetical protein